MNDNFHRLREIAVKFCNQSIDPRSLHSFTDIYALANASGIDLSDNDEFASTYILMKPIEVIELGGYLCWPFLNKSTMSYVSLLELNNFMSRQPISEFENGPYANHLLPDNNYFSLFSPRIQSIGILALQKELLLAQYRPSNSINGATRDKTDFVKNIINETNLLVANFPLKDIMLNTLRCFCARNVQGVGYYLLEYYKQAGPKPLSDLFAEIGFSSFLSQYVSAVFCLMNDNSLDPYDAAKAIFALNDDNGHIIPEMDQELMLMISLYSDELLTAEQNSPMHAFLTRELPAYLASDSMGHSIGLPANIAVHLNQLYSDQSRELYENHWASLYAKMIEHVHSFPGSIFLALKYTLCYDSFESSLHFFNIVSDENSRQRLVSVLTKHLTDPLVGSEMMLADMDLTAQNLTVNEWPKDLLIEVGTKLLDVFEKKNLKTIFEDHPGITKVFAAQAEHEGWSIESRIKFAKKARQVNVRALLISALQIPIEEFHHFSNSTRRLLLESDLSL